MFDFDAGKLVIIGIVALVVIGPKELPRVLRQVGQAVAKMRKLAAEFQGQFMEAMREADLADIKADVAKLAESAKLDANFNPIHDLKTQITDAVTGPTPVAVETASLAAEAVPAALPAPDAETASLAAAGIAPAAVESPEAVAVPLAEPALAEAGVAADAHPPRNEGDSAAPPGL
jgi:sec-independent protein translocase protein TatB